MGINLPDRRRRSSDSFHNCPPIVLADSGDVSTPTGLLRNFWVTQCVNAPLANCSARRGAVASILPKYLDRTCLQTIPF